MIKNLKLIRHHGQLKELGSQLKYNILQELINAPATCQQLATKFDQSKQKVHYNLSQMIAKELIEIVDNDSGSSREVFYRATAKRFLLDMAVGMEENKQILNNQGIIGHILEEEHQISLSRVAARLLEQSFKLHKGERLLIVCGKFNFPLVEKMLLEAGKRGIDTSLIYQDLDQIRAKYEDYSLAAFQADYEEFNRLLKQANVYLNLNGESRMVKLTDPDKIVIRNRMLEKGKRIIQEQRIRIAMMPGLLQTTLSDQSINSEIQFWNALDIDYPALCRSTVQACKRFEQSKQMVLGAGDDSLQFEADRIIAECGSFGTSPYQSPVINLPGGEVLFIPKAHSMHGVIAGDRAIACGEEVINPRLEIKNNEIVSFSAETGQRSLAKAISLGGVDGRKVALICLGTNTNLCGKDINYALKHKSNGVLTVFWGDNRSVGGNVCGTEEWFVQIEQPNLSYHK